MINLLTILLITLSQMVTPCANCELEHPIIEYGYVVETFGNSAIFEVQGGEIIEWYLGDEPVSVEVGDSVTIVACEVVAVNGKVFEKNILTDFQVDDMIKEWQGGGHMNKLQEIEQLIEMGWDEDSAWRMVYGLDGSEE